MMGYTIEYNRTSFILHLEPDDENGRKFDEWLNISEFALDCSTHLMPEKEKVKFLVRNIPHTKQTN